MALFSNKVSIFLCLGAFVLLAGFNQPKSIELSWETNLQDTTQKIKKAALPPAKPMAMAMRIMYDQLEVLKKHVENNDAKAAAEVGFPLFHLLEPTDKNVLDDNFFVNADNFYAAAKAFKTKPADLGAAYNTLQQSCISCHKSYCPGPIRRINKLNLEG